MNPLDTWLEKNFKFTYEWQRVCVRQILVNTLGSADLTNAEIVDLEKELLDAKNHRDDAIFPLVLDQGRSSAFAYLAAHIAGPAGAKRIERAAEALKQKRQA